jgi:predicted amidohydrolase
VTVATLKYVPRNTASPADAVRRSLEVLDRNVPGKTDVIVLGEVLPWYGTRGSEADAAEPVPGPSTEQLGAAARARKSYIVAGLVERDGPAVYNTAVLIDRQGRLAGKYRKVHLPYTEIEWGITPGSSYPVFQTDFGKVGIMICWDTEFPEPTRALVAQGAELILVPAQNVDDQLLSAHALENRVFIVTSNDSKPSIVLDPKGEQLAAATRQESAAVLTIDLNRSYESGHLGNMRARIAREGHLEITPMRPGFIQK